MPKRLILRRVLKPKPAPQAVENAKPRGKTPRAQLRGVRTLYEAEASMQAGHVDRGRVRLLFETDDRTCEDRLQEIRETLYAWSPHPTSAFAVFPTFWIPVLFDDVAVEQHFVVRYLVGTRNGERSLESLQMQRNSRSPYARFHVREEMNLRLSSEAAMQPLSQTVFEIAPHHIVFIENQTGAGVRGNFAGIY